MWLSLVMRQTSRRYYKSSHSLFKKVASTRAVALAILLRSSWRPTAIGGMYCLSGELFRPQSCDVMLSAALKRCLLLKMFPLFEQSAWHLILWVCYQCPNKNTKFCVNNEIVEVQERRNSRKEENLTENWKSGDVYFPLIRTAVCLRRWVLLFEGRVSSPLWQTVHIIFHESPE
jgi:hypothetical protein